MPASATWRARLCLRPRDVAWSRWMPVAIMPMVMIVTMLMTTMTTIRAKPSSRSAWRRQRSSSDIAHLHLGLDGHRREAGVRLGGERQTDVPDAGGVGAVRHEPEHGRRDQVDDVGPRRRARDPLQAVPE